VIYFYALFSLVQIHTYVTFTRYNLEVLQLLTLKIFPAAFVGWFITCLEKKEKNVYAYPRCLHRPTSNSSSDLRRLSSPIQSPVWSGLIWILATGCCYIDKVWTTQKTRHVIHSQRVHWCADCCLATSYKHPSYCCLCIFQGVYQAITWQWSRIVGTRLS
jgi:hypothetical protein